MKTATKNICFITVLSLSIVTSYADTAPSIAGDYQCQRTDASNETTTYPLSITKTNDTYTFEWADNSGNPVFYGTGVSHSNLPNVIASSFWDPKNPDTQGIEMIEVKPDGSLQASWVLQSNNQIGSEDCTKSK